jgi:hypothetical protein
MIKVSGSWSIFIRASDEVEHHGLSPLFKKGFPPFFDGGNSDYRPQKAGRHPYILSINVNSTF